MSTPTKPLPKPSTDHDLSHITSDDWLATWDEYVCAILEGLHSSHGSDPSQEKKVAAYVGELADAMMAERQERAQGHVDQAIVEKADKTKK